MRDSNAGREFGRFKWQWIDQVVADRKLPPTALRVACILASQFLNKDTFDAWPAQATLCEAVGVEERQVRNLIDSLKNRGHLEVKRGGRGKSNHYRPVILTGNPSAGQERSLSGNPASFDRQSNAVRPAVGVPPNPYIEPSLEPDASGGGLTAQPPTACAPHSLSREFTTKEPRRRALNSAPPLSVGDEIIHDQLGRLEVKKITSTFVIAGEPDGYFEVYRLMREGNRDLASAEYTLEAMA